MDAQGVPAELALLPMVVVEAVLVAAVRDGAAAHLDGGWAERERLLAVALVS